MIVRLDVSSDEEEEILRLATEDEISVDELFRRLAAAEDARRHIDRPPFSGEVRARCSRELCSETQQRQNAVGAEES